MIGAKGENYQVKNEWKNGPVLHCILSFEGTSFETFIQNYLKKGFCREFT